LHSFSKYLRSGGVLNGRNDVHAFQNLAKDNVLPIQPGGLDSGDEELRSIGILTSVGHRQKTGCGVAKLKVFVSEASTVDGLATGSVMVGEVTSLDHEVLIIW